MEVTTENFIRQLEWLRQNRRVVDLETAITHWEEPYADRLVALTFDDGYEDTYTTAYPRLKEFGVPFTLYLATESIETGVPLGIQAARPLTWDQVGEMVGSGLLTLGSHTHRHVDLRSLPRDEIETELNTSDELIEVRLGVRPHHFAYPWGYWSEAGESAVRERYRSAVLGGSPKPTPSPDPLRLHRYPVQLSDGFRFFRSRLSGGLRLEEFLRRRLRGYSGP